MKALFPIRGYIVLVCCLSAFASCKKDNNPVDYRPVVHAGTSQTITLPVDSVRLTGSATDSGSKIVAYLWSEVSGPNVPVLSNEGSRSTSVNGLIQGSYIFQLMAVDSLGDTGVDTVSVIVKPQPGHMQTTDTLTLGAGAYEMTYLCNTSNYLVGYFGSPEFLAASWTINGIGVTGRSLFKFDLSALPGNTQVVSAKLLLYSDPFPQNGDLVHSNYGVTNDFFIERVAASWDANTAWANQPAWDSAGRVHIPQTDQPFLDLTTDVTAMVNKMIASGNYGFVMHLNTEAIYNSRIFISGSHADATRHPRLILTY
jgi:hypothetical protein